MVTTRGVRLYHFPGPSVLQTYRLARCRREPLAVRRQRYSLDLVRMALESLSNLLISPQYLDTDD
jgi:hypothetical protein